MIYVAGDLHLGRNIKKSIADTAVDSFIALWKMAKLILEDVAEDKTVLLAGDIFNSNRVDGEEIAEFSKFMDSMNAANISVCVIQGNHDKGKKSIAESLGCSNVNKTLTGVTGAGPLVYGLDHMSKEALKEELKNVPPCDFLLLHQGMEHLISFESAFELNIEDVPAHVGAVVCGHVHKCDIRKSSSGVTFVSPGSLHATDLTETGQHGFYKCEGKGALFEFVPVDIRKVINLSIACEEDIEKAYLVLQSFVDEELAPIVRIGYIGTLSEKVHVMMDRHPDKIYVPVPVFEKLQEGADLVSVDMLFSLDNAIPLYIDGKREPQLFDFVSKLTSSNAKEVLEDKYKEALEVING